MTKFKGIDVSEHNGVIAWETLKKNGVEFAIIRSSYGHFVEDAQFRRNVKECERIGMPYGLYHYSYVADDAQMKTEAAGFIRLCKSCKPSYPCFIDMEDADGWKASQHVSNAMNVQVCSYTCLALEANGFYAGIYANLDWWVNRLNSTKLDRFDKWVAQWASVNTYQKPYQMWQYTSDGSVSGYAGRLDMNISYIDYPKLIKEKGLNGYQHSSQENPNNKPDKQPVKLKYAVGDKVSFKGLWTQSNGGNWYPVANLAVKEGTITKIIKGTQHPYLINHNIGWTNDDAIIKQSKNDFKIGQMVRFDGLWTQSNGGIYYPAANLLVKQGKITNILTNTQHPYLINGNVGWAEKKSLHAL